MLDRLALITARYDELTDLLAEPAVAADHLLVAQYAQERAELEPIVEAFRRYNAAGEELDETRAMLDEGLEPDMEHMVREEIATL
jgi:peptide chain release factor 1